MIRIWPQSRPQTARFLLISCAMLTFPAAYAQTPVAQSAASVKASAPPAGTVSAWPESASLKAGTRLLVTVNSNPYEAYPCKVAGLDDHSLTCAGGHHRPVIFERSTVQTIALPARDFRKVVVGVVAVSAVLVGGGLFCALAGGGTGCGIMMVTGLGTALFVPLFHAIDVVRGPGLQTPVYIAPGLAAAVGSIP